MKKLFFNKRIVALGLVLVMMMQFIPMTALAVEEYDGEDTMNTVKGGILDNSAEPTDFGTTPDNLFGEIRDSGTDADPVYQPYLISEHNEIVLMTQTESDDKITTTVRKYDTNDGGAATTVSNYMPSGEYKFVEGIAFDPTGSGRNDHIAYVGMLGSQIHIRVINTVTDTVVATRTAKGEFIYTAAWLNEMDANLAANYIEITAGDYDNDGHDSIIVYIPVSRTPEIHEYELSGSSLNRVSLMDVYFKDLTGYIGQFDDEHRDHWQLTASLTTGDFDGDGIDELAASIGTPATSNEPDGLHHTTGYDDDEIKKYTTRITVLEPSGSGFTRKYYTDTYDVVDEHTSTKEPIDDELELGEKKYRALYSGSIASGDIDADGLDEIIAVGYTSEFVVDTTDDTPNDPADNYKISGNGRRPQDYYNGELSTLVINYAGNTYTRTVQSKLNMNTYTEKGFVGDAQRPGDYNPISPLIGIETAELNGEINPAYINIAGDVYDQDTLLSGLPLAEKKPLHQTVAAQTADYAKENIFAMDIIKGNFNGNDQGREQFLVVAPHEGDETKSIEIIGGVFDDETNNGEITKPGGLVSYKSSPGINGSASTAVVAGNQAVPVAVDYDDDGLLGKFSHKAYSYADPEVIAVLQAAPYFDEIATDGFSGAGSTSYTVSTEYTQGYSTEDEHSWAAGFAMEMEFQGGVAVTASIEAGYTGSRSDGFDEALSTGSSYTFTAGSEDVVALQKTPMVNYIYDIYNGETNEWEEEAFIQIFPLAPTYYTYSIDDYNALVDDFKKVTIDTENPNGSTNLRKIDANDMPADNEGKPWNYFADWNERTGAESLTKETQALSYVDSSQTSESTTSTSETDSTTLNHGFEFSASVMVGGGALGNKVVLGGYGGYGYNNSVTNYTTTVTGTAASGTVTNLAISDIQKDLPISTEALKSYGFSWNFGKWNIDLSNDNKNIAVYGYVVDPVSMPPNPPENIEINYDENGDVEITWKEVKAVVNNVQARDYRPAADSYNLFHVFDGVVTQLNDKPITDTSYTVSKTLLDSDETHEFFLTSVSAPAESRPSEFVEIEIEAVPYMLTYGTDIINRADISGKIGNTTIESGEEYLENSTIKLTVTAKDGFWITGVKVNDGAVQDITPSVKYTYTFILKNETDVEFITAYSNSVVNYQSNDVDWGTLSAQAGGISFESGQRIVGDAIISAQAKDGYFLDTWTVQYEGQTAKTVEANGATTYKLSPSATPVTVIGNFKAEVPEGYEITVGPHLYGKIALIDNLGDELDLDENGKVKVARNSVLTVIASPTAGYTFSYWTGDFEGKTGLTHEITVLEEMTIGAVFYPNLAEQLTYSVSGEGSLDVMVNGSAFTSGDYAAKKSMVTMVATPDQYRTFTGWTVDGAKISHEDELYEFNITNDTNVVATFVVPTLDAIEIFYTGNPTETVDKMPVLAGKDYEFGIEVTGENKPSDDVTWSISGQNKLGTAISQDGVLTIDPDEAVNKVITIKAVSKFDTSVETIATVEVTPMTYTVTVESGGGVNTNYPPFEAGELIKVFAFSAARGMEFDEWVVVSGDGVVFDDANDEDTSFTMPANDVVLKATFKELEPEIGNIYVNPYETEIEKGDAKTFYAHVELLNGATNDDVEWSVTGATSADTAISSSGVLAIGADETATSVTVVATSDFDDTASGNATVTIVDADPTTPEIVEYDVDVIGGLGSGSYEEGDKVTIYAIASEGEVFDSWSVTSGTATLADDKNAFTTFTMLAENVEVTANFVAKTYSTGTSVLELSGQHPNANRANVSVGSVEHGGDLTFSYVIDPTFKLVSGEIFGASTNIDISEFENSSYTVTNVFESLHFTLIVTDKDVYNVTFNANYDDVTDMFKTQSTTDGKIEANDFTSAETKFARPHYRITGWSTSENGGDMVDATTVLTADTELYAQWDFTWLDQNISFDTERYLDKKIGDEFTQKVNGAETNVTYSSSNEKVATVNPNTGKVKIVGAGTAYITATAEKDEPFKEATATYYIKAHNNMSEVLFDATTVFDEDYAKLDEVIFNGSALIQTLQADGSALLSGVSGYTANNGYVGIVEESSVKVTLYKEFIATLAEGTYVLSITTKDATNGTGTGTEIVVPAKTEHDVTVKNDGTGTSGTTKYTVGDTVELKAGTYEGYTFKNWTIENGEATIKNSTLTDVSFVMLGNDVEITANWTKNGTTSGGGSSGGGGGSSGGGSSSGDEEIEIGDEDVALSDFEVPPFEDIGGHWAEKDIIEVVGKGYLKGLSDTEFDPDGAVTRAMIATVLHRLSGEEFIAQEKPFEDIPLGEWFSNGVGWADYVKVTLGVSETEFAPDIEITREQLVAMMYRYASYKGLHTMTLQTMLGQFEDSENISEYAVSAMEWAVYNKIITGKTETTIDPQGTATRAEISAILVRFLALVEAETQTQTDTEETN